MNEIITKTVNTLDAVKDSLNRVEVKGEGNLNALLASIQTLSGLRGMLLDSLKEKEAAQ